MICERHHRHTKPDEKAIDTITSGNLTDWGQYQRKVEYRKALADARMLVSETLENILKEEEAGMVKQHSSGFRR